MTDNYPNYLDPQFSVILGVGVEASYMFGDHFGIGTGVNYTGYGYLWEGYGAGVGGTISYTGAQSMLEVPIFLRMVSGNGGGFFVNFGLINSFLLGSEQKVELSGDEIAKATGSESNADFASVSISPFVYLGGNIRCGNRVQMTVGPQFSYQLNTNFSNSSGLDGHYFNIALKVGVGIHAYKRPGSRKS